MHHQGNIKPDEAFERLEANPGAVLVDVRTQPEWAFVGVPAVERLIQLCWQEYPSMQVNPDFISEIEKSGLPKDTEFLFICRSGARVLGGRCRAYGPGLYQLLERGGRLRRRPRPDRASRLRRRLEGGRSSMGAKLMKKDVKSRNPARWGENTRLVRGGLDRSPHGETSEALYLNSGFVYDEPETAEKRFAGEDDGYVYGRYGNPTVSMFEERLRLLEGAESCYGLASGMAAVFGSLACQLKAGDHLVASKALFGSCYQVVTSILPRFGIRSTLVDGADITAWKSAVTRDTKCVFLETPSNPTLEVIDLAAVCDIARNAGGLRRRRQRVRDPNPAEAAELWRRRHRLLRHQAYGWPGQGAWRRHLFDAPLQG